MGATACVTALAYSLQPTLALQRLGPVGEIDSSRFKAMLQGDFGRNVTAGRSIRKDAKARAALDLTFGAPKSITLQALSGLCRCRRPAICGFSGGLPQIRCDLYADIPLQFQPAQARRLLN